MNVAVHNGFGSGNMCGYGYLSSDGILPPYKIKTISGVPPLVVSDGLEKLPKSITIYGNTIDCISDKTSGLYTIPVTCKGVNLYNAYNRLTTEYYTVDSDGWITAEYDNTNNAGAGIRYLIIGIKPSQELKPNTTYKIITEIKEISGTRYGLNVNGTTQDRYMSQFATGITYSEASGAGIYISDAVTLDNVSNSYTMLRSQIAISDGSIAKAVFRISVLEDTTVSADTFKYEPYYTPITYNIYSRCQLNGIGDSTDSLSLNIAKNKAMLIRKFNTMVFDGSEDWELYSANENGIFTFRCPLTAKAYAPSPAFVTSHLPVAGTNDTLSDGVYITNDSIYIRSTQLQTIGDFNVWLTAQAEADTPFTVIYQLETPVTGDVSDIQDWHNIPKLNKGTSIISITTEPEPSKAELEYYIS